MCIIMVKEAGVALPPKERFEGMFDRNPDGAGFMFPRGGWVEYRKGLMTFDDFWGAFEAALTVEERTSLPIVCHFRIGTHGDKRAPTHTHPFPLTDNIVDMTATSGRVSHAVAHNGIFSLPGVGKWKFPSGEKDDKGNDIYIMPSDTMDYVRDIIFPISLKKGWFELKPMHRIIDMTIGYSKLVIMRGDGKILRFGDFVNHHSDDKRILYSNSNYYKTYVAPKKSHAYDDDYDDDYTYFGRRRGKDKDKLDKDSKKTNTFLKPPSARKDGFIFSKFKAFPSSAPIVGSYMEAPNVEFATAGDKFMDMLDGVWNWYIPTRDGILSMFAKRDDPSKVWLYEYDAENHTSWFIGAFKRERSKLALTDKQLALTDGVKDPLKEDTIEVEIEVPVAETTPATEPVA
ncbi:MAG TPA: hypothetical protein VLH56_18705 [Dissulfurispiraceae bacterium]|nr:hypothetical protein [Dissulfurispiraceae bacterium]